MSMARMTGPVDVADMVLAGRALAGAGDGSRDAMAEVLTVLWPDDWMKTTALMMRVEALEALLVHPAIGGIAAEHGSALLCEPLLRAAADHPFTDAAGDPSFDAPTFLARVRGFLDGA